MAEARDRLVRPVDPAAVFARMRSGAFLAEPEPSPNLIGSTFGRVNNPMTPAARGRTGLGATRGGGLRTPRTVLGRYLNGSHVTGQENTPRTARRGSIRVRPGNSVLPSWYPRTPLRDITAVVRAIERRRARFGEVEGQQIESPVPEGQRVVDPSVPVSVAPLEHDISMFSPNPAVGFKPKLSTPAVGLKARPSTPAVGKVPKILLGITNQTAGESEFLTPQKKLLNSIDTVEKVVMEELQKLKRTPTAKKAEREKRVRTLLSMR